MGKNRIKIINLNKNYYKQYSHYKKNSWQLGYFLQASGFDFSAM